jgi:FkbM family methyltransferase
VKLSRLIRKTVRRIVWRFGRKAYMLARREPANDFARNGEADLQAAVLQHVKLSGDDGRHTILDIGANIGEWARHALTTMNAKGIENVVIHVFEPIPQTFLRLKGNLGEPIAAGRVIANQCGVAQVAGQLSFQAGSGNGGTSSIAVDKLPGVKSAESLSSILVTSIDDYVAAKGLDRIVFAKVDTEGNDFNVVLGAAKMFDMERIDIVQFEYNHRWVFFRRFLKDVFDFIAEKPYHIGKLSKGRIELISAWHPELERYFETNFVIAHERSLAWLPIYRGKFDSTNSYA